MEGRGGGVRRGRNVLIWRPGWQNIQLLGQKTEEGSVAGQTGDSLIYIAGLRGFTSPDLGQTSQLPDRRAELVGFAWKPLYLMSRCWVLSMSSSSLQSLLCFQPAGLHWPDKPTQTGAVFLCLPALQTTEICFVFAKFTQQSTMRTLATLRGQVRI